MRKLSVLALFAGALLAGSGGNALADGRVVIYNATNPKQMAKIRRRRQPGIPCVV